MPHLVTLCTGNAARSVMAGAILAEHVPALVVETRGTHVVEGMPMSWRTRDAIVAVGARVDGHRSRQLATADLTGADVVLAMAGEHVEYVRRRHPDAAARTGTLKRLAAICPAPPARWPSGSPPSTSTRSRWSRGKTSTIPPGADPRCSTAARSRSTTC